MHRKIIQDVQCPYTQGFINTKCYHLYIYILHKGISTDTRLALYADDTKIWRSIKTKRILHN